MNRLVGLLLILSMFVGGCAAGMASNGESDQAAEARRTRESQGGGGGGGGGGY